MAFPFGRRVEAMRGQSALVSHALMAERSELGRVGCCKQRSERGR